MFNVEKPAVNRKDWESDASGIIFVRLPGTKTETGGLGGQFFGKKKLAQYVDSGAIALIDEEIDPRDPVRRAQLEEERKLMNRERLNQMRSLAVDQKKTGFDFAQFAETQQAVTEPAPVAPVQLDTLPEATQVGTGETGVGGQVESASTPVAEEGQKPVTEAV